MCIFSRHPKVQFYDYTKILDRLSRKLPANYDLTGSLSEDNRQECIAALSKGGRIAVVFNLGHRKGRKAKTPPIFPTTWEGHRIISGEDDDTRYKDPSGVVVGLTAKGDAVFDTTGFVIYRDDKGIKKEEQHLLHAPINKGVRMREKTDKIVSSQSIKIADINKAIDTFLSSKKRLLTDKRGNPKIAKGEEYQVILHLSPANEAGIINMCPLASMGCKSACLHTAGVPFHLSGKIKGRLVKTWFYALRRKEFMEKLSSEIDKHEKKAYKVGKTLVARLNGTSDVAWEKIG